MGDIQYACGVLYGAAFELVKAGDIRNRLYNAYSNNALGALFESDFPEGMIEDLRYVKESFLKVLPSGNADNIRQSLSSLSDEEAEKLAEKILDLAFVSKDLVAKQ